jgi:hypothetical protein
LTDVHDKVGNGVAPADAERAYRRARASYERTILKALPEMADFLTTLSPAQAAALEGKLAKAHAKIEKDVAKPTRNADRAKRLQEQFADFVGTLTAAQKAEIQAAVDRWPAIDQAWLADRKFRQAETVKLVKSRPSRDEAVAGIKRLLLEQNSWRSPGYVMLLEQRERLSFELYARLLVGLSTEQQATLKKRLKGYEGDIIALMMVAG